MDILNKLLLIINIFIYKLKQRITYKIGFYLNLYKTFYNHWTKECRSILSFILFCNFFEILLNIITITLFNWDID